MNKDRHSRGSGNLVSKLFVKDYGFPIKTFGNDDHFVTHLKKIYFLFSFLSFALGSAWADKRPPDAMIGDGVEIPCSEIGTAVGISSSTLGPHDRTSLVMSLTLGEPFSGDVDDGSCEPPLGVAGTPCRLGSGYGYFEFYSDRLPVQNVDIKINGGRPVTNQLNVDLEISFKDDLAGLEKATVREEFSQNPPFDLLANQMSPVRIPITLQPTAQNQEFRFDFYFKDRAGNETGTIVRSITLDRVPPEAESVVINGGNKYVNGSTVNVTISCIDAQTPAAGIDRVWVTTSPAVTSSGQIVASNQNTTTIFGFNLGQPLGEEKTVYAKCEDGAGNWSPSFASSSIITGFFNPGGTVQFKIDGTTRVVVASDGIAETPYLSVPVIISWNPDQTGNISRIETSILEDSVWQIPTLNVEPFQPPRIETSIEIGASDVADSTRTIKTIFVDSDGNASAPVLLPIRLNRTFPGKPIVTSLGVQVTSMTFTVYEGIYKHDVSSISFSRRDGSNPNPVLEIEPLSFATQTVTHVVLGLAPNTGYSFDIRAHDLFRESEPAEIDSVLYTRAASPAVTGSPEGLEISVVRAAWGTNGNPVDTEYQLEYSRDPDFNSVEVEKSPWSVIPSRDVEDLELATTYFFRVKARNKKSPVAVETDYVFLGSTATLSFLEPKAPLKFYSEHISSTSVEWRWIRQNSTEEGFFIENSTFGLVHDFPILSYSTNVYSLLENNLIPNTQYVRYIRSYNHFQNAISSSAYTIASALTLPAPPCPQALTVKGSAISAHWLVNGNPEDTEFNVRLAMNAQFTNSLEDSGWMRGTGYEFKGLKPNTSYYVDVQARGREDDRKNRSYSDKVLLGSTKTETYGHGGAVNLPDLVAFWKLLIPPNAYGEDYTVRMEGDCAKFSGANLEILRRATEKAREDSGGYRFPIPGGLVEIGITNASGVPMNPPLQKEASLVHSYSDIAPLNGNLMEKAFRPADIRSLRVPAPEVNDPADNQKFINVKTLRIWKLNPETESWVRVPNSGVNLESAEVESGIQNFGIFAVMGAPNLEVGEVIAYPVPWRPNGPLAGNGPGQTGTEAIGITFTDLPQEGNISIFDLSGQLIWEKNLTGKAWEPWDVHNSKGEAVGSGTYFWVTEAGGNRKKGKVMVIR